MQGEDAGFERACAATQDTCFTEPGALVGDIEHGIAGDAKAWIDTEETVLHRGMVAESKVQHYVSHPRLRLGFGSTSLTLPALICIVVVAFPGTVVLLAGVTWPGLHRSR